jgi:DNA (cytosine-5)-methyltransferase 1
LKKPKVKFVDLFAGIGGIRIGFEQACIGLGIDCSCVFSSEIKQHAIKAYTSNFNDEHQITGDITKVDYNKMPDFDYLLAGFPCQPFSSAGNRKGFLDERGNLFFNVLSILKAKKPRGFLLENVEGLVTHDGGETLKVILSELKNTGYKVSWKLIDSSKHGIPQKRIRVYIVGHFEYEPLLEDLKESRTNTGQFIDEDLSFEPTEFSNLLTNKYNKEYLYGKSIKDKRGGDNNIHSWQIGLKGSVTDRQANLLTDIFKKRRYKKWAEAKGIDWMDGMPLTIDEIKTFQNYPEVEYDLEQLTTMGYLKFEHPKKKVTENGISKRVYKLDSPKGYNIVSGRLSFPFTHILDPNNLCPTLVATEAGRIAVSTKTGVRSISVKEGLALSGFPNQYDLSMVSYTEAFDLIGNTVMPPVIKIVSEKLLRCS